jgi:hypothetical protein
MVWLNVKELPKSLSGLIEPTVLNQRLHTVEHCGTFNGRVLRRTGPKEIAKPESHWIHFKAFRAKRYGRRHATMLP